MLAGKLNRRITIERFTETRDEFNAALKSWATLARVWASKYDISDAERIAAQEIGATLTTRFQIRYSETVADLSPRDRLTLNGVVYDINAVKEIGLREGLEITAAARPDLTAG